MACNNCNETQDPNCGCTTEALRINQICNPIVCPSDECSESFSAACIRYTGADLICNNITVVETDTNVAQALSNIISFICTSETVIDEVVCGEDVVIPEGTEFREALELIVTYFCEQVEDLQLAIDNIDFPVDAIVGGTGITVTSNTVGTVTTFTITNDDIASLVTLTSAGGTSLVFDGAGPSLSTKGLTAGSGIFISAAAATVSITNTAPDQIVAFTSSSDISVTGTYPNFDITHTGVKKYTSGALVGNQAVLHNLTSTSLIVSVAQAIVPPALPFVHGVDYNYSIDTSNLITITEVNPGGLGTYLVTVIS
jgi:hypothetical protein